MKQLIEVVRYKAKKGTNNFLSRLAKKKGFDSKSQMLREIIRIKVEAWKR